MRLVEETVSGQTKQLLRYTYIDNSGNTQTTDVDVSLLLAESEFKDGLQVNNAGEVSVKRDSTSENFLSVSSNGVKVSGIQDAIDDAKTAATAYTQTQIEALDYADTAVSGQYVSEVDEADGVISVQRANVSEAVLNNYSKGSDATAVAATDTVNQAISKLENQVDAAKAAATTEVLEGTDAGNNLSIASGTAADGHVQYTVNLTDVASATALTAEIAARKAVDGIDGDAYSAHTGASYISAATSLDDADVKLDTALKNLSDSLDGLDYTGVTDEKTKVLTDVKQENGLISASATTVGDLVITAITTSDTKVAANDDLKTIAGKLQGWTSRLFLEQVPQS